mmetsp:Transcript_81119/g.161312  ORF Transcript_81119/g.161312 Transcript_81119/m.161312 type:complete len:302 (+) Transcript_81119:287-1192(+)
MAGRELRLLVEGSGDRATRIARVRCPALDGVAHLESEGAVRYIGLEDVLVEGSTLVEARSDHLPIKILTNEDESIVPRFAGPPVLRELALELHVHSLIDKLLVNACHREHSLHAVDVVAFESEQLGDPGVGLLHVELAGLVEADRVHALVVLVLAISGEEFWVHLEDSIELKPLNVEHVLKANRRVLAAADRCPLVEIVQSPLDPREVSLFRHEIDFVEQQHVGKGDLLDGLVLYARWLLLVEVLLDVLGVDERDDCVEAREALDVLVDEEGLGHRRRICQASRLDDNVIEFTLAVLLPPH